VVDCDTLLRIAAGEVEVGAEHKLVAPTLVRSQALAAMYEAARRSNCSRSRGNVGGFVCGSHSVYKMPSRRPSIGGTNSARASAAKKAW